MLHRLGGASQEVPQTKADDVRPHRRRHHHHRRHPDDSQLVHLLQNQEPELRKHEIEANDTGGGRLTNFGLCDVVCSSNDEREDGEMAPGLDQIFFFSNRTLQCLSEVSISIRCDTSGICTDDSEMDL